MKHLGIDWRAWTECTTCAVSSAILFQILLTVMSPLSLCTPCPCSQWWGAIDYILVVQGFIFRDGNPTSKLWGLGRGSLFQYDPVPFPHIMEFVEVRAAIITEIATPFFKRAGYIVTKKLHLQTRGRTIQGNWKRMKPWVSHRYSYLQPFHLLVH